jgi:hypothetical protein
MRSTWLLTALIIAVQPTHLCGQVRESDASSSVDSADTFADAGARDLVLRALALRDSAAAGLQSYEAVATERTHVGMNVTKRLPIRSRTLYHRERVARVFWTRSGTNRVRWIGMRTTSPTTGDRHSGDALFGIDFDIADELDLDDIGVDVLFDPLGDRIDFFEADFIQPISRTGLRQYTFASGDTMRIVLPPPSRTITVVEVVVRPREVGWESVEGSLWFDRETGILVRAAYRPSGTWDEEERDPHSLDDVPGFLKPAIGTVTSIVVEYALLEQRWWLPRRVAGSGVFDWGNGLLRMPLTIEWTMTGHSVNREPTADVSPGPDLVRTGTERRNGVLRTEYLAPADVDLSQSRELPPPLVEGGITAFSPDEMKALVRSIERSAGAPPGPPSPSLSRVLARSVRYDRVRGLSVAYATTFEAGAFVARPELRLATALPDLLARIEVHHRTIRLAAWHDIADASDWNIADGIGNSANALLFGHDGGDYYRIDGGGVRLQSGTTELRTSIEAFAERHRDVDRQTNASLATIGGGSLRPNLDARDLTAVGIRASVTGQAGFDTEAAVVNWTLKTEVANSERSWARALADVRVTGALSRNFTGSIDIAAGMAGNGAPPQREFLLGGAASMRGVEENTVRGAAFWLSRAEIGRGRPELRAVAFIDAGWAGDRGAIDRARPVAGTGLGLSFLDGLFRADIARGIVRANAWRAYFYIDAIL